MKRYSFVLVAALLVTAACGDKGTSPLEVSPPSTDPAERVQLQLGSYSLLVSFSGGGSAGKGTVNANAARYTLGYTLNSGSTVEGCTVQVDVSLLPAEATLHQHTCDPETGARNLVINNPARGTPTAFVVQFATEGSRAEFNFQSTRK